MIFGMRTVFFRAAGIAAVAVLLQIVTSVSVGARPDYVLVTLVTLGAILTFGELVVLTAGSVLLLLSRPDGGIALLIFIALPLAASVARRYVPWRSWFANLLLILAAGMLFLAATAPRAYVDAPLAVAEVLIADVLVGMLVYGMMQERAIRRRGAA